MSDGARDLLVRGVAAIKEESYAEARRLLERALVNDPDSDQKTEILLWLVELTGDRNEQRDFLERVLSNDPTEPRARRKLAILDGKLKTDELFNPNKPPVLATSVEGQRAPTGGLRFTCPKCGGKMTYAPDGHTLVCEYCESRRMVEERRRKTGPIAPEGIEEAKPAAAVKTSEPPLEQDFIVAMATAKGHVTPTKVHSIRCQGCGVEVILSADQLTTNCPYCGSAYVLSNAQEREYITPGGVIPFSVTDIDALRALDAWSQRHKLIGKVRFDPLTGVYLPVWGFDIGGHIPWRGMRKEGRDRWVPDHGDRIVFLHDILIPAARKTTELWERIINDYNIRKAVAYEPGYLANWPAETYSIAPGDASLEARKIAFESEQKAIRESFIAEMKEITFSSSDMLVETFRLILLPVWITHYSMSNRRYLVYINGQTARVRGEHPTSALGRFLGMWTGEED